VLANKFHVETDTEPVVMLPNRKCGIPESNIYVRTDRTHLEMRDDLN
jgi:hypothetical protein